MDSNECVLLDNACQDFVKTNEPLKDIFKSTTSALEDVGNHLQSSKIGRIKDKPTLAGLRPSTIKIYGGSRKQTKTNSASKMKVASTAMM